MTEPPSRSIEMHGRPVDPEWGRYLDDRGGYLNEEARRRHERYQEVRRRFPNLPLYHDGMTTDEWRDELHRLNPETRLITTDPVASLPITLKAPLNASVAIAEWHAFCRALARSLRDAIRQANESGDPEGAGRIHVPPEVSAADWWSS